MLVLCAERRPKRALKCFFTPSLTHTHTHRAPHGAIGLRVTPPSLSAERVGRRTLRGYLSATGAETTHLEQMRVLHHLRQVRVPEASRVLRRARVVQEGHLPDCTESLASQETIVKPPREAFWGRVSPP